MFGHSGQATPVSQMAGADDCMLCRWGLLGGANCKCVLLGGAIVSVCVCVAPACEFVPLAAGACPAQLAWVWSLGSWARALAAAVMPGRFERACAQSLPRAVLAVLCCGVLCCAVLCVTAPRDNIELCRQAAVVLLRRFRSLSHGHRDACKDMHSALRLLLRWTEF